MRPMTGQSLRLALYAAAAFGLFAGDAARAQSSCQADFEKLSATRNARIQAVNALSKQGKGKLDPVAACPRLQSLAGAERAMLDYMVKNQKWCGIPDNVIADARKGSANTQRLAGQACNFAAQAKRMRAQAERQAREGGGAPQAPRMPTGPL
jgi:hypothetical protein